MSTGGGSASRGDGLRLEEEVCIGGGGLHPEVGVCIQRRRSASRGGGLHPGKELASRGIGQTPPAPIGYYGIRSMSGRYT